jgi:uncharacterized cupin superfamily protein
VTWFVRNARDARWRGNELGAFCTFENEGERFPELGINLTVVEPGQPMCMYHREPHQEGFLVLRGECLLIVEGEEVPLRQWDFFHCPPDVPHVIVGAREGSSLLLAVGSRLGPEGGGLYPADETAIKHGAGVERDTSDPREAYARFSPDVDVPFREEFLR